MNNTNNERFPVSLVTNDSVIKGSAPLKSIIGQTEARKMLSFFIDSHSKATPCPTLLFTGSQGLGKTFMAAKVAKCMGRELIEVNCSTIETVDDFVNGVLLDKIAAVNQPVTLLMDEAQVLTREVVECLKTILAPNDTNKNILAYKNILLEYDFARINIIFATTDAYRMDRALLDRCEHIYFHTYSNKELFDILSMYLPTVSLRCDKDDIAHACRGRARDAFMLSQKVQRYVSMKRKNIFGDQDWAEVKDVFSIHPYGLKTEELKLMSLIAESQPISSNNLAVRMGVNVQNIEGELEIRPRELGFIENGSRGRCLTEEGKKYLALVNK